MNNTKVAKELVRLAKELMAMERKADVPEFDEKTVKYLFLETYDEEKASSEDAAMTIPEFDQFVRSVIKKFKSSGVDVDKEKVEDWATEVVGEIGMEISKAVDGLKKKYNR